ncbi:efflux RND transporter periplasmic adaptor subunit [bacterium]|nr:efflux RND transporter periplasmic adaptor subunit [bacterium]
MKKRIIIAAVIVVAVVGILLGITLSSGSKNNAVQYETAAVDKGHIQSEVVTSGTLNPVTTVDVGSEVSGKISNIHVDFNSEVEKGQVIAKLDQELFKSRVKQNEANYQSALASLNKAKVTLKNTKRKYERTLELFEKELVSYEEKENAEAQYYNAQADVEAAEARLEQAKSQLDSSRLDLEHTIIRSPIDGVVINKNFNEGQTVAASFQAPVLFQIAQDLSQMQVECSVDEADIGKIKNGQKTLFTVDAYPDDEFSGKVSQVRYAPQIEQNVVTYTTIVKVNNPEMKLRPGMTATVTIIVGEAQNALRVPNSALRFTPQLPPQEMKEMFQEMREERAGQRSGKGETPRTPPDARMKQRPQVPGGTGTRKDQPPRVWILKENGDIRPVLIKTGISDTTYTEVLRGNLEEGQKVITGAEFKGEKDEENRRFRRGPF